MKKLLICAVLLSLTVLLVSCRPAIGPGGDSTNESQIAVTSPDGFEDVTAPPQNTPPADTTKKPETSKDNDTTEAKTDDTTKETPTDTTAKDTDGSETAVDTTVADTTLPAPKISTPEEAIDAAKGWLGTTDPTTGYKYAFSYDGTFTENKTEYFKIRVSWFIEEQERYSLCGYLLVSPDGDVSKYSW